MPLPAPGDRPTDGTNVETADHPAPDTEADAGTEADQIRRQDPDAPALGAVDDYDEVNDLPEPSEPG
jgi:hypothetical protein